jgi:hypothetical protein
MTSVVPKMPQNQAGLQPLPSTLSPNPETRIISARQAENNELRRYQKQEMD